MPSSERTSFLSVRWTIGLFLLAITTHAFFTRFSMSIAVQRIQAEFHLSNVQIGWILSSFIAGYGVIQLPVGVLVDRLGTHRLLGLAILGWSALHGLTGLAGHLAGALHLSIVWTLVVTRFVMGVAQSPLLSCCVKAVGRWMPLGERALGSGVFMAGLGLGGGLGPPAIVALILWRGWPFTFYVLAAAGMVLGLVWLWYGSDAPETNRRVSRAELQFIRASVDPIKPKQPVPWRALLSNRSTWCLALSYGVGGYPSYVFFTWFFLYVVNVRHVDMRAGGYWAALPYFAVALGTMLGGRLSDGLTVRFGKRLGRLTVVLGGATLATSLIVIGARVQDARIALVLLSLAAGFHLLAQTPSWAAANDLAPSHAGTLFGMMNTFAQAAGVIAPVLTPAIAARLSWTAALDFAAALAALAGLLWIFVRPDRNLTSVQR